jgi:hypothetical protein
MRYRVELLMIGIGLAPLLMVEACGSLKKKRAGCEYAYVMNDGRTCRNKLEAVAYGGVLTVQFNQCDDHRTYTNPTYYVPKEICHGR